jgi:uncharacterized protein (DUF2236 family)
VSDEEYEARTKQLEESHRHKKVEGLHGPNTMSWLVFRESFGFIAGGRAVLLQLAHPFVALGIEHHSNIHKAGVQQRFLRTFSFVFPFIFGDLDSVLRSSRTVRTIHGRVNGRLPESMEGPLAGQPYSAHHAGALFWVWSTLFESSIMMFEMLERSLTPDEKIRLYEEGKTAAYIFGLSPDDFPPSYEDFMDYNHRMWSSSLLTVTAPARSIVPFLIKSDIPIFNPSMRGYMEANMCMLPPCIAEQFGCRQTFVQRLRAYVTLGFYRLVYSCLPGSVRFLTPYVRAVHRIQGGEMPLGSRLSAALAKKFLELLLGIKARPGA